MSAVLKTSLHRVLYALTFGLAFLTCIGGGLGREGLGDYTVDAFLGPGTEKQKKRKEKKYRD